MTSLAERLVPCELWQLSRLVVPEAVVVRPQGGGRQRAGGPGPNVLARRLPPPAPLLRTHARALPRVHRQPPASSTTGDSPSEAAAYELVRG